MFATYGSLCFICGHDGARDAGHLVALARAPDQELDPDGMRPMHGALSRCATCGRCCNNELGTKDAAPARLITSEDW